MTEGFGGKGVFYVWAAGNGGSEDNSNLDGRANFYAVTAACATGWRNRITDHSERGSNLWGLRPRRVQFRAQGFAPGHHHHHWAPLLAESGRRLRRGSDRLRRRRAGPGREPRPDLAAT